MGGIGFRAWRNAQRDKSAKTLNEYLTNAGAFFSWLEKSERLARNPLRSVQRIERHGESSHKRRALTDEAMRALPPLIPTHHQSAPESALDLLPDGLSVSHGVQAVDRNPESQPA